MMRDNEFLATYPANVANAWTNFLAQASIGKCVTSTIGVAPFCTLDPAGNGTLSVCPGGSCGQLYLSNVSPYYYTQQPVSGVTPKFTRTIQAISLSNDEKIVSKVSWNFHGTFYSVTVTDHLTPWQ
jgi:hypothetical protein